MSIGIYDVDLWHRGKTLPNLELMKIYNYHYNIKNEKVIMLRPKDNLTRFSRILYFKENPNTQLPNSLNISPKAELYGYGFFNFFYPIENIYSDVPPTYDCYDLFEEKFNAHTYKWMKRSSYIRFENHDFSDFNKNKPNITVADYDFLYMDGAKDFFEEYKNYNIMTRHSIILRNEEIYKKFMIYSHRIYNPMTIDYPFSKEFLEDVIDNNYMLTYRFPRKEKESEDKYLTRLVSIIMYYKINNGGLNLQINTNTPFLKYICNWGTKKTQMSYYDFFKDNKEAILLSDCAAASIRLLLKSDPKKLNSSNIDFYGLL